MFSKHSPFQTTEFTEPAPGTETEVLVKDSKSKMGAKGKKKGKKDMDDLKRELEMNEHRMPLEELINKYQTDPVKVSINLLRVGHI